MNRELYDMIYKRKSFHLFRGIEDSPLAEEELAGIRRVWNSLVPLVPGIRTAMDIVPADGRRDAEYSIRLYSEQKEHWPANIGYLGEQLDLWLVSKNIGTLWFGIGKPEEAEKDGLSFVIMILIRRVKDSSKFRRDMFKSKRKSTDEIWIGKRIEGVSEIVRFAPSACNTQPWIVKNEDVLSVYRYRKPGKRGIMPADRIVYYSRIDMGIFLCFLELCMEREGIRYERTLHADHAEDEETVLTAEYRLLAPGESMKLLAVDYDGTLKYGDTVTEEDLSAIKKWRAAGNLFVIDTGRSLESILAETEAYGIPVDYYVTNNGGMAFDRNGSELFSTYLDNIMSLDIMYIAKQIGGVVSYVVNDGVRRHRIIVDPKGSEKRYPSLKPDMSEEELMKLGKYAQFVISMETKEEASCLAEKINEHFPEQAAAYANKYVCDIVPKGVSKAAGLAYVCAYAGVTKEDTYTLGDADNDLPLIQYCDNGACMSSADPDVKKHARHLYDHTAALVKDVLKEKPAKAGKNQ